jgi:HAD domain in Swiss Army Knife RNA repair proteins
MMKPIVFLDIDGVARPNTKPNNYLLNAKNVALLNKAFEFMGAEIVVSSNWRLTHPIGFFNSHFGGRVIGKTRDLDYKHLGEHCRWHEILKFMESHIGRNFYVLDDQAYHFPKGISQLVLCNEQAGFNMESFDMLIMKFNNRKII